MLDIQQKRKVRAFMYNRITIAVLFVVVLLSLRSTWVVYSKKVSSEDIRIITEKQVSELRERNNNLESKIDKLATVSGVEEEIRSKFSVAKNDEKMVVIVPSEEKKATTTNTQKTFWGSLKSLLGVKN